MPEYRRILNAINKPIRINLFHSDCEIVSAQVIIDGKSLSSTIPFDSFENMTKYIKRYGIAAIAFLWFSEWWFTCASMDRNTKRDRELLKEYLGDDFDAFFSSLHVFANQ